MQPIIITIMMVVRIATRITSIIMIIIIIITIITIIIIKMMMMMMTMMIILTMILCQTYTLAHHWKEACTIACVHFLCHVAVSGSPGLLVAGQIAGRVHV